MIQPDPAAQELASFMASATDAHREIIAETLTSAESGQLTESGRTICPSGSERIHGPLGRFPRSVELASCPIGSSGIMHSHVSIDQLRNPEHSLPDTANVLFGNVGASMVIGVESHEILVAPSDADAAAAAFSDVLGVEVQGTGDVVQALKSGNVPNPPDARARVRNELSSLFSRVPSALGEFEPTLQALGSEGSIPAHRPIRAMCPAHAPSHAKIRSVGEHRTLSHYCQSTRSRRQSISTSATANDYAKVAALSAVVGVFSAWVQTKF